MHIPDGFAQVAPYIFAGEANEYMDHLIAALGGVDAGRTMRGDLLANGIIRFGGASIMVSEATPEFPPSQAAMYFYVEDADASMRLATENGMAKIMDVADMPYGDRQGGVKDGAGSKTGRGTYGGFRKDYPPRLTPTEARARQATACASVVIADIAE